MRMADGRKWTTSNLNGDVQPSCCYADAEANCRRYGRLYPWQSAGRACRSLGADWRLPLDDERRQLSRRYGGVMNDSADGGRAAFTALLAGGAPGFNAVFGGHRSDGAVRASGGARAVLDRIGQRFRRRAVLQLRQERARPQSPAAGQQGDGDFRPLCAVVACSRELDSPIARAGRSQRALAVHRAAEAAGARQVRATSARLGADGAFSSRNAVYRKLTPAQHPGRERLARRRPATWALPPLQTTLPIYD